MPKQLRDEMSLRSGDEVDFIQAERVAGLKPGETFARFMRKPEYGSIHPVLIRFGKPAPPGLTMFRCAHVSLALNAVRPIG